MYRRETRILLRHYPEQGMGKTELAGRFASVAGPSINRSRSISWIEPATV